MFSLCPSICHHPPLMNDEWVFRAQEFEWESSISRSTTGCHSRHWALWPKVKHGAKRIQKNYHGEKNTPPGKICSEEGLVAPRDPLLYGHLHLCRMGVTCGQMVSCDSSIWHPPALCRCKCLHQAWSSVMVPRAGSGYLQFNCAYFTLELLQGFVPESLACECEGRIWAGHHSGVSPQLSEGCSALVGSGTCTSCCYSRYKWGRIRAVK